MFGSRHCLPRVKSMPLPHEMMEYAENIWKRFPEEFIALGMPGLEQTFDLRKDGTRKHRICENAAEKTIEITIRRWDWLMSMNPFGPSVLSDPSSALAFQSAQFSTPAWMSSPSSIAVPSQPSIPAMVAPTPPTGIPQQPLPPQVAPPLVAPPPVAPSPVAPVAADTATIQQIDRLEAALALLKPQVEAALQRADKSGAISPTSPLRTRRNMPQLNVATSIVRPDAQQGATSQDTEVKVSVPETQQDRQQPQQQVSNLRKVQAAPTTASTVPMTSSPSFGSSLVVIGGPSAAADGKAKTSRGLKIQTARVAPSAADPESPRSPGKFSAWSSWK